MGSSKKPKPSASPGSVHPGPDQVGDESDAGPSSLTIRLINVRPPVHAATAIGDPVTALVGSRPLIAAVPTGALGEIPPQHISSVEHRGYRSGVVAGLEQDPVSASVTLNRG